MNDVKRGYLRKKKIMGELSLTLFLSLKKALESKGARPFLISGFLTSLGDWIYFVAMSAFLFNQFGPIAIGLLSVIRQTSGMLFAPVAGFLADKYSKKKLVLLSNLSSAFLMAVLLILTSAENQSLLTYLIIGTLLVLAATLDRICKLSLVPNLVDKEDRLALNSLLNTIGTFSLMVAPIIGGFLVGTGVLAWNFLFNTIAYILSFCLLSFLPKNIGSNTLIKQNESLTIKSTYKEWIVGVRAIFKKRDMRSLTILMFLNHVIVGSTFVFIPMLSQLIGLGDQGIGYLLTAIGVGSIIGALIGAMIGSKSLNVAISIGVIGLPLTLALSGFHEYMIISFLFVSLLGIFANIGDGPMWTYLQRITPSEQSGRVFSTVDVITVGGMSLGSLITGFLISYLSLKLSLIIFASVIILVSAYSLLELITKNKGKIIDNKENAQV
ncbi:MFS transporter [Alkalihalobacillus sp. LMS6]|uniref:MFS transporter n=1 Tax=Alkalihalobacillus sp. LMS6 TaxID=2924034 RepID=UPI0020D019F9|nr:MFS transporter [Alkalihalobacillus sp. LMS6]UTR06460.1 MFS transporter [Alkalihalobacillus sp. LMS6]